MITSSATKKKLIIFDFKIFQDYVTIYDGYTTRDPIILKFCGGGQSVPASISSGPELLVEFTTSPFGTFIMSQPSTQPLNGFQLEVFVFFLFLPSIFIFIQLIDSFRLK